MLPYAEMEIAFGKEVVQFKGTAINKIVGCTKITKLINLEKELCAVTQKWGFHTKRIEEARKTLQK